MKTTNNMDRDNMNADSFNTDKINTEEVDFAVQQFIRRRLEELYPEVQFLSEEKSNEEIDKDGLVWVLDPVDGTTNLIHDYRASVISLALMQKGSVVLGMIYNPYTDELFSAQKGEGSYCNGQKIEVSGAETMEKCLIALMKMQVKRD